MDGKDYTNVILGAIGSFTAFAIALIVRNIKQIDAESRMPPEYWIAKQAETEAEVKRHQILEESRERLIIDQRERADVEKARKREFEMHAPKEYWDSIAIAEREKTNREKEITRRKLYE